MQVLRIDPTTRTVELLEVEPEEVAQTLHASTLHSLELDADHVLVMDDDPLYAGQTARFSFHDGTVARPFFAPALVIGLANSNWAHTTLDAAQVAARLQWEVWDATAQRYVVAP